MSDKPKDYEIGWGKPPEHTRWKKGQSGNSKRIYKRRRTAVEMIDAELARKINIVERGTSRQVTVLEAIVIQLALKATKGRKAAMNALLAFQRFAASRNPKSSYEFVYYPDSVEEAASQRRRKISNG